VQQFLTILRRMLRHLGIVQATVLATIASAALSVLVAMLVMLPIYGTVGNSALLITLSVSVPVSALFSYVSLRLTAMAEELHEELHALAHTDTLTGLANRRSFLRSVAEHWPQLGGEQAACAIIVFDIDHFKLINDQHGHAVGDRALTHVAACCLEMLEPGEIGARIGGEEFAILLPSLQSEEAALRAEQLRAVLTTRALVSGGTEIPITASFGVADNRGAQARFDQAWIDADRALYRAKRAGRNRVEVAQPGPTAG
jgi:diguanylate cyclase (GGDEF)-like protein